MHLDESSDTPECVKVLSDILGDVQGACRCSHDLPVILCSGCRLKESSLWFASGVSIEGTIITTRDKANQGFYGRTLTAKQLLLGSAVNQPPAAKILYAALQELMDRVLPVAASSR